MYISPTPLHPTRHRRRGIGHLSHCLLPLLFTVKNLQEQGFHLLILEGVTNHHDAVAVVQNKGMEQRVVGYVRIGFEECIAGVEIHYSFEPLPAQCQM